MVEFSKVHSLAVRRKLYMGRRVGRLNISLLKRPVTSASVPAIRVTSGQVVGNALFAAQGARVLEEYPQRDAVSHDRAGHGRVVALALSYHGRRRWPRAARRGVPLRSGWLSSEGAGLGTE